VQLAVNRNPSPTPGGRPPGGFKASGAQEYSEVVEGGAVSGGGGGKSAMFVVLIIVLSIVGYAAYEMFVNERNPIDAVTAWYGELTGAETEADPGGAMTPAEAAKARAAKARAAKAEAAALAAAAKEASRYNGVAPVAGNPYWALPNKIFGRLPLSRTWTSDEEETFRAGITHRFSYQRWQTVQTIRKMRLSGSDVVLWDAMQDRKLWTRMGAAVGLAELNIEVSLNVIEGLIQDAGSELVADYFERYTRTPNAGQAFMLRQVIRILDEKGRLIALQGIERSQDGYRDLYLAAATRDPGRHVQQWVQKVLSHHPIPPARMAQLLRVVDGAGGADAAAEDPGSKSAGTSPKTAGKGTSNAASGGAPDAGEDVDTMDPEAEYEPTDGDVEFYETDEAEEPEPTDPETFEYSE
jgi:hypothetical protein